MPNDIASITFSGFQSFGDYETTVELGGLGPCLIVGMINGEPQLSNGSGKSAFINAPLWCWWDRTMHTHVPGDRIINTHCEYASVTTHMKDGQVISRKRKRGGESELSVNGEILGTTKLQQRKIMEILGCDWNKFTSSAFITQMHKPWLSMTAPNRRKAFEKLFKLDIINEIANVAKGRIASFDANITKAQKDIDKLKADIVVIESNIAGLLVKSSEFETEKLKQINQLMLDSASHRQAASEKPEIDMVKLAEKWAKFKSGEQILEQVKQKRDNAVNNVTNAKKAVADKLSVVNTKNLVKIADNIDIDSLQAEWIKYNEAEAGNQTIKDQLSTLNTSFAVENQKLQVMKNRLAELNSVETTCLRCGQPISHEQVTIEIAELTPIIEQAQAQVDAINEQIKTTAKKQINTAALKPKKTEAEAKLFNDNNDRLRREKVEASEAHATAQAELADLTEKAATISAKYTTASDILEKGKPQYTEQAAKLIAESKKLCLQMAEKADSDAVAKKDQCNPYDTMAELERGRIAKLNEEIDSLQTMLNGQVDDSRHMAMLRKSYNDKNMIKSDLVGRLVSEFNSYLAHYTELFGSEVSVSIDNSLNVNTTCEHDYEFCSGGEKQRVDLGVDLSTFMTYMSLYGKFSNLMVLDEVDSKMDSSGVSALVTAVNDDLSSKFDTILVVSHMQRMRDSFPTRIVIDKRNGFSHLSIET